MSSAPRGLAPCEGLELVLMKMGCAGPPFEPRHRPQAGKSRDPHSQNADTMILCFPPLDGNQSLRGYYRCFGNGDTQTCLPAACGLRRGSSGGPSRPIFISSSSRPSRGAKPRGVDDRNFPQERPHQADSRGGGEINARVPHDVPVTQAMTTGARRAPARAVSSFPLWCKRGKRRRGVPRHQAKVSVSVQ